MNSRTVVALSMLLLHAVLLVSCSRFPLDDDNSATVHQRLDAYIDSIDVIDTHEHQRMPPDIEPEGTNFYSLLRREYINADLISAGSQWLPQDLVDSNALDSLWNIAGQYLDYSRNTSYYSHFRDAMALLYGFEDKYFTRQNVTELSRQISENYSRFDQWYKEALDIAGIEMMFNDQYWSMYKTTVDHPNYRLVFRVDELVRGAAYRGKLTDEYGDSVNSAYHFAAREGVEIRTLDDYLQYGELWFKRFTQAGAVCTKCALAYHRSLYFEEVSRQEAQRLYARAPDKLNAEEKKKLEDFMMHWCVEKSGEYDLMMQIHTGYLAGNSAQLDNGRAVKLINLFRAHTDTKIDLFHGGYPWWIDIGALGKSFPNVYIDLVWLPQISRRAAVEALHEWLDAVPNNKFFWGGDCWSIEGAVGSLEIGRSVVAQVLAEKVEKGLMTEELAREVATGIFRRNAIAAFGLEKKLGPGLGKPGG